MKKIGMIAMIAIATLMGNNANAQLQKGNVMVGGHITDFGFGLGSRGNFNLNLSPRLGYFIQNNIALGALVNLNFNAVSGQDNTYSYRSVIFGRYYIPKAEIYNPLNDGRFFAEVQTGLRGVNGTGIGFNLAAGAGYAYFVTPNVAIEASALFHTTLGTGNNTGLEFNVGFMVHLPTGKIKDEARKIRSDINEKKSAE